MKSQPFKYFAVLAELEHYTKAAEKLSITQPSLSHAVTMMERELLPYVKRSLDTLDEGIQAVGTLASRHERTLQIAYIYALGSRFIPELTKGFLEQEELPEVQFHFAVGNTGDVIRGLKEEEFDIGFCSKLDAETAIEFCPVTREELVVVVPAGHPLAGRKEVRLEETAAYPQIFFTKSSGLRPLISHMYKMIHKKPQIAYQIEEDTAMKITEPVVERNIYLAYLKDRRQSEAGKRFIRYASARGHSLASPLYSG